MTSNWIVFRLFFIFFIAKYVPGFCDYIHCTQVPIQHRSSSTCDSASPQRASDNRLRGNSMSSMSADRNANLQLSWSTTTAMSSVGSGSVTTPASSYIMPPGPGISSPKLIPREISGFTQDIQTRCIQIRNIIADKRV
jgi:hypothetical protein